MVACPPAVLLAFLLAASPASPRALPEARHLIERVIERDACAAELRESFAYRINERRLDVTRQGRLSLLRLADEKIWNVVHGSGRTLRFLVSEGGRVLGPAALARERERIERRARPRRAARVAPQEVRDLKLPLLLRACELRALRRVLIDGRSAIEVEVRGKRGFRARSPAQKLAAALRGTLWIDEEDLAVVRAEATVRRLRYLGGLAASVAEARFAFEQLRIEPGLWLPAYAESEYRGRLRLLDRVHAVESAVMSAYSRFGTETSLAFRPPEGMPALPAGTETMGD